MFGTKTPRWGTMWTPGHHSYTTSGDHKSSSGSLAPPPIPQPPQQSVPHLPGMGPPHPSFPHVPSSENASFSFAPTHPVPSDTPTLGALSLGSRDDDPERYTEQDGNLSSRVQRMNALKKRIEEVSSREGDNSRSLLTTQPQGSQNGLMGGEASKQEKTETGVKMSQMGVTVERRLNSILVNGLEVAKVPMHHACSLSQIDRRVYLNGICIWTPDLYNSSMISNSNGVRVERIKNSICVNNVEVTRVPPGVPVNLRQMNGYVFVNGRLVYPVGTPPPR